MSLGVVDLIWIVGPGLWGVFVGGAIQLGRSETERARFLFLISPIPLIGAAIVWAFMTDRPFAERVVLSLGQAFETATPFHALRPDLSALGIE